MTPDSGYFGAYITGGSVTFTPGDGHAAITDTIGYGGTSATVSQAFTFSNAGAFSPTISYTVDYSESYNYLYWTQVGTQTRAYSCGLFGLSTCYDNVPIYGWAQGTGTNSTWASGSGTTSVNVVEPSPNPPHGR